MRRMDLVEEVSQGTDDAGAIGWPTTKTTAPYLSDGSWCRVQAPSSNWKTSFLCESHLPEPLYLKVLSYNLFWWNLFGVHGGNHGSAGALIAAAGKEPYPFDFIAFQECDDVDRILSDAGLRDTFATLPGTHGVAAMYRTSRWQVLKTGGTSVAEDSESQYYGKRIVLWARLRERLSGTAVFFMNHHGPLPVSPPGGKCGPDATAYALLKVIGFYAHPGDKIALVGDFNADRHSETIKVLSEYLNHLYTGTSFNGVDNFFAACGTAASTYNLGSGGSDHDALAVVYKFL